MANKINFITGETYTLAELFSGERRIIIPDLQRDYCWGDENNIKSTGEEGELVSGFVNNLLTQFDEYQYKNDKEFLNLGLFYGYEVPANHIQLCDGQQRLTTLYLLLGMINKKTIEHKENGLTEGKFRHYLISDFEYKHDDKEPYLNYAIRESSLYFLSDLVCKFFVANEDNVETIKSADWYFDYYNLDSSIQSMLKALAKIESFLKEKNPNCVEFGDWLLNKVTFLYFDMENRKNGEETFVVINTTGESLSSTQNLKPLVLQEKNEKFDNTCFKVKDGNEEKGIGKCWEEIETWFWKKRKGDNDTADAGFAEFLRWISIIEQVDKDAPKEEQTNSIKKLIQLILQGKHCDFPYKEISFETIYDYWKSLKWIIEKRELSFFVKDYLSPSVNEYVNNRNAIGQNDCFVLLPVLKYIYKNIYSIESDACKQRNAKRIYEFFKNLNRIDNVSKAVNTLVCDTIKIIDLIKNGDLVDLIDPKVDVSNVSKQILTAEEKKKLEILRNSTTDREKVEEAFWKAQEHNIWSGEIIPMIEWATDENGNFVLDLINKYAEKIAEVFDGECNANIDDNTRRALLTRGLNGFPRVFRGYTNYCFGWDWSDWQVLINDNKDKFKDFFDDLLRGNILQNMIDSYVNTPANTTEVFYRFVKYPELLSYCEQKNIQKWDNSYCLVKKQQAKKNNYLELETSCLYLELMYSHNNPGIALSVNDGIDYHGWKMRLWEETALEFDKEWNGLSVAIDVHFNRAKADDWDIQLFLRQGKGNTETDLEEMASSNELQWNGERYELKDLSKSDVKDKINALLSEF